MVIESSMDDARFNFLSNSADGYHALFEKKLAQFRLADPGYEDYHRKFVECYVLYREGVTDVSNRMDIKVFHAPPEVRQATIVDKVAFLVSKYAWEFKLLVMGSNTKDPRFDFLMGSPEDPIQVSYQRRLSRYCFQNHDKVPRLAPYTQSNPRVQSQRLVLPYLLQCRLLEDKLNNNTAYMNTVLEGFLERILWDLVREHKWLEGGENSMIEWHNSVSKDFVEDQELLPKIEMPPPAPPQKRPELDESALVPLEPEDQFLAQHEGLSIFRVICVPDGGEVIKITVQSLSENVASLKEKIAEVVQIQANEQTLRGLRAVLKDNNRSLAYYNVKAGDILILDVV
ncbi:Ubiquitin domain [Arabidopsis thaliana x Arabidopsis arenosa]|uniref:Ubiquitin domain n=1 Tax=Arabidopsis thaliana x Arabidopsis arenosa TaxID=1240361 RepID=A0A8T2DZ16_9BRAS|nr:Ubiquitin domain [Arabidopsis thaliana x Arabidopsis arenosa]